MTYALLGSINTVLDCVKAKSRANSCVKCVKRPTVRFLLCVCVLLFTKCFNFSWTANRYAPVRRSCTISSPRKGRQYVPCCVFVCCCLPSVSISAGQRTATLQSDGPAQSARRGKAVSTFLAVCLCVVVYQVFQFQLDSEPLRASQTVLHNQLAEERPSVRSLLCVCVLLFTKCFNFSWTANRYAPVRRSCTISSPRKGRQYVPCCVFVCCCLPSVSISAGQRTATLQSDGPAQSARRGKAVSTFLAVCLCVVVYQVFHFQLDREPLRGSQTVLHNQLAEERPTVRSLLCVCVLLFTKCFIFSWTANRYAAVRRSCTISSPRKGRQYVPCCVFVCCCLPSVSISAGQGAATRQSKALQSDTVVARRGKAVSTFLAVCLCLMFTKCFNFSWTGSRYAPVQSAPVRHCCSSPRKGRQYVPCCVFVCCLPSVSISAGQRTATLQSDGPAQSARRGKADSTFLAVCLCVVVYQVFHFQLDSKPLRGSQTVLHNQLAEERPTVRSLLCVCVLFTRCFIFSWTGSRCAPVQSAPVRHCCSSPRKGRQYVPCCVFVFDVYQVFHFQLDSKPLRGSQTVLHNQLAEERPTVRSLLCVCVLLFTKCFNFSWTANRYAPVRRSCTISSPRKGRQYVPCCVFVCCLPGVLFSAGQGAATRQSTRQRSYLNSKKL